MRRWSFPQGTRARSGAARKRPEPAFKQSVNRDEKRHIPVGGGPAIKQKMKHNKTIKPDAGYQEVCMKCCYKTRTIELKMIRLKQRSSTTEK
jgi:hypothetical protein